MGWSENYWDDIRSELDEAAAGSEPAGGDDGPGLSGLTPGSPGAGGTLGHAVDNPDTSTEGASFQIQ